MATGTSIRKLKRRYIIAIFLTVSFTCATTYSPGLYFHLTLVILWLAKIKERTFELHLRDFLDPSKKICQRKHSLTKKFTDKKIHCWKDSLEKSFSSEKICILASIVCVALPLQPLFLSKTDWFFVVWQLSPRTLPPIAHRPGLLAISYPIGRIVFNPNKKKRKVISTALCRSVFVEV